MESRLEKAEKLSTFYRKNEYFPPCIFMFGLKSTGKKLIIRNFLDQNKSWLNFVIVQANECYTSKILFDTIVNELFKHKLSRENNFESYAKIDTIEEFLLELGNLDRESSYLIVIQDAERLRDMEFNIIPVLMRLKENTRIDISTLFESHLPPEKFGIPPMPIIYVPNYTKNDIVELLTSEYGSIFADIIKSIETDGNNVSEKMQLTVHLDREFYKQFLNIFINVTFKMCRDFDELAPLAVRCYKAYYTPVINGEIKYNDVTNLWRNISNVLKNSINGSYMKVQNISMKDLEKENMEVDERDDQPESKNNLRTFAQNLELPYYAKYLLIASFLASHNDAKYDKRLFMKHHGRERKRANKPTASEKMNTQFGPKSFTIDRLLAIFYAILDEKVGLTCNLLAQISTLVDLNFLSFVSGEGNIMDGNAKIQSTIGLEFALNIGKVVGFNVKQYLTDFY